MADMMKSKLAPVPPKKAPTKKMAQPKAPPITRISVSSGNGVERSVSVRKIENGYVIRESCYNDRKGGGYSETERYSATAPKIDVAGMAKGKK